MSDPSYNYSYTPTVDHRESNLYREEYYSSTDTKIYMDNEEQTEIGYIQYELQEQLKPVYGYNSRTFDDVVIGNRIVTGTFTVPIKNKEPQDFDVTQLATYMKDNSAFPYSTTSSYNKSEEDKLYDTDWLGSTARNIDERNDSNIDMDMLVKLIALGYDVTANASEDQYKKALQQFQREREGNSSPTGVLNEITKNKIDEDFNKLSSDTINLEGEYGYDDVELKKGKILLHGNGLITKKFNTDSGEIWQVLDSDGVFHYLKGTMA